MQHELLSSAKKQQKKRKKKQYKMVEFQYFKVVSSLRKMKQKEYQRKIHINDVSKGTPHVFPSYDQLQPKHTGSAPYDSKWKIKSLTQFRRLKGGTEIRIIIQYRNLNAFKYKTKRLQIRMQD